MNTHPSRRAVLLSAAGTLFAKADSVELGVCGPTDNFSKAEKMGFDYYEPNASLIAAMSDAAFATFRDQVQASRIRCKSVNNLIRMKVVGPDVNLDAATAYLDSTLERCRPLGTSVVVWGSSRSRQVPDGFSRDEAWNQIKAFLLRAGDVAKSKKMVIGIEPLRKQESNIINTGAEALRLVHEVNHPQVKMIIDYFHLATEKESPDIIKTALSEIVHMHFAYPVGRRWPKQESEDSGYKPFFDVLKEVHYNKGLSIEGNGTLEADGEAALAFFRRELA